MTGRRRALALAGLALLALGAGACAPPPPGSSRAALAARYGAAREVRAQLARALGADLVVRAGGRGLRRVPALTVTLALAAPDRARVEVGALLGVGLDVLARGNSLWAWVPSERLAFTAPGESLGLGPPAAWLARVVAATWDPPARAWRDASADSAGWRLSWCEGADSLRLGVDARGRPREVTVRREGRGLRLRYDAWLRAGAGELPARWEVTDDAGWVRVRVEVDEARPAREPGADWFAPRASAGLRTLDWDGLRDLLSRGGSP